MSQQKEKIINQLKNAIVKCEQEIIKNKNNHSYKIFLNNDFPL